MFVVFYTSLGFCLTLPELALKFYGRDELLMQPAEINSFYTAAILPWAMKPMFGLISDSFAFRGQRRRPYVLLGCTLGILGWTLLSILPAVPGLSLGCLILAMTGVVIADVACDSMVVEFVKKQASEEKGKLQSKTTMSRFIGGLLASIAAGVSLGYVTPRVIFACAAAPLLLTFGVAYRYREPTIDDQLYSRIDAEFEGSDIELNEDGTVRVQQRIRRMSALRIRLRRLIDAFKDPTIKRPLSFLLLLMCMPSSSTSVFYFMTQKLHFEPFFLSMLGVIRHACGWMGAAIYRAKFRQTSLRKMFVSTTLIITVFSGLQIILVTGANETLGISARAFVLSGEAMDAVVESLGLLPLLVLTAKLTPDGNEGSVYCSMIAATNLVCSRHCHLPLVTNTKCALRRRAWEEGFWAAC